MMITAGSRLLLLYHQSQSYVFIYLTKIIHILQEISNARPLIVDAKTSTIEFRDVNFKYINGKPIFNNLNLTIPAGKKIGIVGGSGSG